MTVLLVSCGGSQPNNYANAAIGAGIAAAANGINRAATGECWGSCRPGTVCDRATGLCMEERLSTNKPKAPPVGSWEPHDEPPGHEYEVPAIQDAGPDAKAP